MYTYKVVEENKESPEKSIIEMGGLSNRITVEEIDAHLSYVRNSLKEAVAQIDVFAKQDKLAFETSEVVKKFCKKLPEDEGELQMIQAYIQRKLELPQYHKLKEECVGTIQNYEDRLIDIRETLGIEMPKEEVKEEDNKDAKSQEGTA